MNTSTTTKTTSGASRCDRILTLIDQCLAEYEATAEPRLVHRDRSTPRSRRTLGHDRRSSLGLVGVRR